MFRKLIAMTVATAIAVVGLSTTALASKGKKPKPGKIEGTLVATTSSSATIQLRNFSQVTVIVNSNTKIELNDQHVPLSSLPIGSKAEAVYNPTTMIATKVESET